MSHAIPWKMPARRTADWWPIFAATVAAEMPPKPQPLRDLLPPDLKLHPYPESDRRLRSSNYNHERGGPQSHTYFRFRNVGAKSALAYRQESAVSLSGHAG